MEDKIKFYSPGETEEDEDEKLIEEVAEEDLIKKIKSKIPLILVVVFYLVVSASNGRIFLGYMMVFLIFPVSLILFPDHFGKEKGFGYFMNATRITNSTPSFLVKAGGWMLLCLPIIIYFIVTGGKISILDLGNALNIFLKNATIK